MTARCVLSADRSRATLADGTWRETIDIAILAGRLTFYRKMRDRRGGAYAKFHQPMVAAIEKAMTRAGMACAEGKQ